MSNLTRPVLLSCQILCFSLISLPVLAAPAGFFSIQEKWEKRNALGEPVKGSLDKSFEEALKKQAQAVTFLPPPPPKKVALNALAQGFKTAEVEQNQSLVVSGSGIVKFIAVNEGIVSMETLNSDILNITGTGVGRTFIHVWDSAGRSTFEMRVLPPTYIPPPEILKGREALEGTRSFEVNYSVVQSAFYTGVKYREVNRTNEDTTQNLSVKGDSPYGYLTSHALTQRDRDKTIVTEMQAKLENGRIGPYKDFNLTLADDSVRPGLIVFPQGRIRGVHLERWNDRLRWEGFYGREQTGLIGTVSPGLVSKRTQDSFLGGGVMDFKMSEKMRFKGGYFTGSGKSREDVLNRRAVGLKGVIDLSPHLKFEPETGFDSERFVNKHALTFDTKRLQVRQEFRDIRKKFVSILGSPSGRGELGYKTEFDGRLHEKVDVDARLDVFRDDFIPNPADLIHWNFHKDARLSFLPTDRSSFVFHYQDHDDTGRIGPTKQRTTGVNYAQRLDIFGHRSTLFSRYQNRGSRNLNNPDLDYVRNQAALGLHLPIFWNVNFSIEQEWNHLEEPNIRRITHPSALTYTLDTRHRIGQTPFDFDLRLRIRDEEETESINSFMKGEDSAEISGGIYYRGIENMEIYATGRFENFNPESRNVTTPRVEAQFYTGVRYLYDTGVQWLSSGSFEGFVFKDLDGNGEKTPDEPGLEGMQITAGDGQQVKTNAQGYYEIKSVSGRKAVLTLENKNIPFGFAPTTSMRREVEIVHRQTQELDFGLTPRSEVRGIIFNDLNGNGRYDLTDRGVLGVRAALEDGRSARTNSQGVYFFPDVIAGEHTVSLDMTSLPEGYVPLDVPKKTFTLYEGLRYELNFPLKTQRAVTGRVFLDANGNGILESDEKTVSDVKVTFGERNVFTDPEGWYLFDNLNSGEYELGVDSSTVPDGWIAPSAEKVTLPIEPITLSGKNLALRKEEV